MAGGDGKTRKRMPWSLESLPNHNVFEILASQWWVDEAVWTAVSPGVFDCVYKLVKAGNAVADTS